MCPIMRAYQTLYSPLTVAAGLLSFGHAAQAQTTGSFSLATLAAGGTTYSLVSSIGNFSVIFPATGSTITSACNYNSFAEPGQTCGNISVTWTAVKVANVTSLALAFSSTARFGLLGGALSTHTPPNSHLYLNYQVKPALAANPVIGASLSLAGNLKNNGSPGLISISNTYATEYLCPSGTPTCQGGTGDFASLTPTSISGSWASNTVATAAFNQPNLNVSTDVASLANASDNNSGYNITLLTETFKVPEPVSISVLGVGAAAAAAARRWRRKPRQTATCQDLKLAA